MRILNVLVKVIGPSFLCSYLWFIQPAQASIIFVDADAEGSKDGSTWINAYVDLQEALASAELGDEIWVAEGVYRPAGPNDDRTISFELHEGVAVYGGFIGIEDSLEQRKPQINLTTLSGDLNGDDGPDNQHIGENAYHIITSTSTSANTILDGFTLTGGNADGTTFPLYVGGGAYLVEAAPVFINSNFEKNKALIGAAIYNDGGDPVFIDSQIQENVGSGFSSRSDGSPTFKNCALNYNDEVAFEGRVGVAIFVNCTIIGNNSKLINVDGAGIEILSGDVVAINSIFSQNKVAGGVGGGALLAGEGLFSDCLFHDNQGAGSGVYNSGITELINCTFHNDSIENCAGAITITNGIQWGYGSGTEKEQINDLISCGGGVVVINRTIVQGWTGKFGGVGNNGLDPLFVDPDGADDIPGTEDDDLRLLAGSPAIDSGDNNALPADEFDLDADGDLLEPIPFDLDGLPRFIDDPATPDTGVPSTEFPLLPIVDRGAYEFQVTPEACEGDANADGLVDPLDAGYVLARLGCSVNTGDPACDAADVNADSLVDPLDVGYVLSRFGECP